MAVYLGNEMVSSGGGIGGGSTGGVTSWNDLKDRPFYENAITWDGSIDGRDSVTIEGMGTFYKVSDLTVDKQSLNEATLFLNVGQKFPLIELTSYSFDGGYVYENAFLCATSTELKNEGVTVLNVPSTGIYFVHSEQYYVSKLVIGVVKLDTAYIPKPIINLHYDGSSYSVDKTFSEISDMIFSFGDAIIRPDNSCNIYADILRYTFRGSNVIKFLGVAITTGASYNWNGLILYMVTINGDETISVEEKTITL